MDGSGATAAALSEVLLAVANANVFSDSKTIVDMPLTASPNQVAAAFTATAFPDPITEPEAHSAALKSFIATYFLPAEGDLIKPFASSPLPPPPSNWLPNITDPTVRDWATALHTTWGTLCRTASPNVFLIPSLYSLLPVPGPFIVPGARFREGYYWDSYWAVKGLLVSGLDDVAKNVVLNLVHCVKTHGFVPNGLRSYYLNRSQPPLLAAMVEAVWESTQDGEFLKNALPALDKELTWWRQEPRSLRIICKTTTNNGNISPNEEKEEKKFLISRYFANWRQPRPESLKEDLATVKEAMASIAKQQNSREGIKERTKEDIFCDVASAAESGWDFSSRWFEDGKSLSTIRTSQIYPADLNALLYRAEKTTATLAAALGTFQEKESSEKMAQKWSAAAEERLETINALHWDLETNRWRDFILADECGSRSSGGSDDKGGSVKTKIEFISNTTNTVSSAIYASDFIPLWCGCAPQNSPQALSAVHSLKQSGLISVGGVAASTIETGEQWDWPNAWPPLQSMLSEGCDRYGGTLGVELAEEIARTYLKTAFSAWQMTGRMFEKFDVRELGVQGGGGEYACMDGFGWTNGLALFWLDKYGWREE